MIRITGIQAVGRQTMELQIPDGRRVNIDLIFHPLTERWYANVSIGAFNARGIRVKSGANLLRPYLFSEIGLACISEDEGTDPFLINDFQSGRSKLYLLSREDIEKIESSIFS